jgi:hypothetical protein
MEMMPILSCKISLLVITMIYYTWREILVNRQRQRAKMNERIARMLWVAASRC